MGTYTGQDKRLKYLFENGGGGGGSANIWTGTMAEYEQQASQIADDTLVCITDDEEQTQAMIVYSTTEQVCGTWIDGKTLYQKTIDFGALPNSTTKEVAHGISNVTADNFVYFEGIGIYPNNYAIPMPKTHDGAFDGQCMFEITDTKIKCYSRSGNLSAISKCYITLRYTKNTT